MGCYLGEFPFAIESAGYELVDARYEERIHQKDARRTYHMVRFVFLRDVSINGLHEEFLRNRNSLRKDLETMCRNALWRVRIFSNPLYKNGVKTPDERVMQINMEVRQPLFSADGQSTNLKPDVVLRVAENTILFDKADEGFMLQTVKSGTAEISDAFHAILEMMLKGTRVDGCQEEEGYIFSVLRALESEIVLPMTSAQVVTALRRNHGDLLRQWQQLGFSTSHLWGLLDALIRVGVLRAVSADDVSKYQFDPEIFKEVMVLRKG
jgi:hypothetical protein